MAPSSVYSNDLLSELILISISLLEEIPKYYVEVLRKLKVKDLTD